MRNTWLVPAAIALLSACSAHSPFILKETVDSSPVSSAKHPSHSEKVFVTEQNIPAGVLFETVSQIEVGKVWYGETSSVLSSIATRAREVGANAVIQTKTWRQPSGWSWAAPHGSGQAIYIDPKVLSTLNLTGGWH